MKQKLLLLNIVLFLFSSLIYSQSNKQNIASSWLENNKGLLEIESNHDFEMLFSKSGLSGETFRFYQKLNNVQVYNAEVTIHVSNKNKVSYYSSTYDKTVENINTVPQISREEAFNIALTHLNVEETDLLNHDNKLYVYNKLQNTKLVYRVYIHAYSKTGAWEVMVDANTGAILNSKDIAIYYHKEEVPNKNNTSESYMANGTAMIYDTDPLTATTSAYGGLYQDNNDQTNSALDAARTAVTLLDIEFSGGLYRLKGPYTEIAELDLPNKGLFIQSTNNFEFNRQEDGFEATNVYYHVDKSMRYINNDLGISLAPPQNNGVIQFDPHGAGGADNSYYVSGTLTFGEGCVDDGEDADVILHELGHGLHDWITNGGLSQVNGLSEGCGDYWANSYKRSLGLWNTNDAARNWVFGWDGHNVCWNGRTTVYTAQYPSGLINQIHTDGQMWATTLMEIWEDIGKEKTDKAFLEGLAMTNGGTNQEQAAIAVRQAAIDMGTAHGYTCADIQAMTDRFTAQGYTLPAYNCNLSVDAFATNKISFYPNPTNSMLTFKNINANYTATIYNMLGQTIKTQVISPNTNTIDVSALNTGTYFIKFNTTSNVLKFIKE